MSDNKLAENLKTLMSINSISPTQLARKTGVGQPVIFRIATGETDNPKLATLRPIARYFNKSISQLVGDEPLLSEQLYKNVTRVPLFNMANAVERKSATQNPEAIQEYVICDCEVSEDAFAVTVEDVTMAPQFQPGSLLIVDPKIPPKDRDFVIAHHGGHKTATFKQLLVDGDTQYLKPINADFRTSPITNDHCIIGTVIRARTDFCTSH